MQGVQWRSSRAPVLHPPGLLRSYINYYSEIFYELLTGDGVLHS